MNSTFHAFQVEENTTFDKIVSGITWILLQFPCNALMIGLVQFDRFGGDPLKRRVMDHVRFMLISFYIVIHFFTCLFHFFSSFQICSLT